MLFEKKKKKNRKTDVTQLALERKIYVFLLWHLVTVVPLNLLLTRGR